MDDLQRFLMVWLEDPEAVATADWLRQIGAADDLELVIELSLADDLELVIKRSLADELELVIDLSAVNLFWWNALTALAAAQHDLKPKQQAVLPASFYSWCVGVAAGALKPPVVTGRPRLFWRDVYIVATIPAVTSSTASPVLAGRLYRCHEATYRRRGVPLERAFDLVAAVSGLTAKSVKGIWLATDTGFELPPMSATVAEQFAELLG